MTGFQADPAKLARHAADFPGLAEQAGAIHSELSTALAAAGPCWGGDAAGQSFADGHVRPANGTLDRLAALPGQLTDVGDRFTATATNYQQVDEYGASVIGGVDGH
ncbi:MAG TPA: hypothetical protein VGL80_23940 [Pseudonocardiaceae bacterium]|jgi:prepilin-type processing-associated H-X9-DG protein